MSAELHGVPYTEPEVDPKELAKAEALVNQARLDRQKQCTEAVNKVLEEHNCQLNIAVQIGGQAALLSQILNLPAQVMIVSK